MKCQVCKAEAPEGASFCQHCGAKLPMFEGDTSQIPQGGSATQPQRAASTEAQPWPDADSDPAPTSDRGLRRDVSETTLWEGSYSPKAMLGVGVGCGLLTLVLLVLGIGFASGVWQLILLLSILLVWLFAGLRLAAKRLGISYKLTNHMFYHRRGVMTRTTDRIELIEIHDVTWRQGLVERVVNVGTVTISSADRTHPQLHLPGIENVESVATEIDKARRSEQLRRGRRIDFSNVDHLT